MGINYRSFGDYVRDKFGEKVYKLPLDAGFTCPNIDGRKGRGGCVYCRNTAFKPNYLSGTETVEQQLEAGLEVFAGRNVDKFFAYFQAHTNTYASSDELAQLYERVLARPEVVGLCLGTRPDCLSREVVELLAGYAESGYEIWVEIGQQTASEETLDRINRGHGFREYKAAVERLSGRRNLLISPHVIFGLPGETRSDMLRTVDRLVQVGLDGVKFHHLQVIRGTPLAETYRRGNYSPLTYEEYRSLIVDALDRLPPDTVVHRLMADAPDELLVAPRWEETKHELIQSLR